MRISVRHIQDHHGREEFRPYVDGQHVIVLEDDSGHFRGEWVWRLANIGQGIAEITGMGIARSEKSREVQRSQDCLTSPEHSEVNQ